MHLERAADRSWTAVLVFRFHRLLLSQRHVPASFAYLTTVTVIFRNDSSPPTQVISVLAFLSALFTTWFTITVLRADSPSMTELALVWARSLRSTIGEILAVVMSTALLINIVAAALILAWGPRPVTGTDVVACLLALLCAATTGATVGLFASPLILKGVGVQALASVALLMAAVRLEVSPLHGTMEELHMSSPSDGYLLALAIQAGGGAALLVAAFAAVVLVGKRRLRAAWM